MRIYISGAITGTTDYKERFKKAEKELLKKGYEVINPVNIAENLPPLNYNEYLTIDLLLLSLCDAIYMLKGWHNSNGAIKEYTIANKTNKLVIFEERDSNE